MGTLKCVCTDDSADGCAWQTTYYTGRSDTYVFQHQLNHCLSQPLDVWNISYIRHTRATDYHYLFLDVSVGK